MIWYKAKKIATSGTLLSSGYIYLGTSYGYVNSSGGESFLNPFRGFIPLFGDEDMPMPLIEAEVDNDIVKIVVKPEFKPLKRSLIF